MSTAQNKRNRKARNAQKSRCRWMIDTIRAAQNTVRCEMDNVSRVRNHSAGAETPLLKYCEEQLQKADCRLEAWKQEWYNLCKAHPDVCRKAYKGLPWDFPENSIWG